MVSRFDPVREVEAMASSLGRATHLCAMLRQEGILSQAPYALVLLADRLLKSLTFP